MKIIISPVQRSAYCTCGAKITLKTTNAAALQRAFALWFLQHQGPGHEPCTAQKAAAARRRAERSRP